MNVDIYLVHIMFRYNVIKARVEIVEEINHLHGGTF